MQPTIATVGNNAATMPDATMQPTIQQSGITQLQCKMQGMQPTIATVGNNAGTMPDATNATNKATVGNNAATLQDETNAANNSNSRE